jgi:LysM repeat protein
MLLNQSLGASRRSPIAAFVIAALAGFATSGCATLGGDDDAPVATRSVAAAEPAAGEREAPLTATEAAVAASPSDAQETAGDTRPVVNPSAPSNYTVKRGDTLWDIAAMFLRDPWLWPEIWQVNPQVENPHLIYPGDLLTLAYGADGRPQIRLTRGDGARLNPLLRAGDVDNAIATIPYAAISAFLERPSVVSKEQFESSPHVVAFRNEHTMGASGMETYVRGLTDAGVASRYAVVRVGEPIRDPDDGDVLGYQGTFAATAVVQRAGDPAKVMLTESARETFPGDRLIGGDTEVPLNFVPRSPSSDISGQIISVVDGVTLIGQYRIVALNRGSRHGLEVGHVLAIDTAGETIRDTTRAGGLGGIKLGSTFAPKVKLPNERNGTLLVFRVYDRMSYGLIVSAEMPVRIADVVRTP